MILTDFTERAMSTVNANVQWMPTDRASRAVSAVDAVELLRLKETWHCKHVMCENQGALTTGECPLDN